MTEALDPVVAAAPAHNTEADLPEDTPGYHIPLTDEDRWRVVRIADRADLGVYDTKREAVTAAEADRDATA